MSVRGDREREIASAMRAMALEHNVLAATASTQERRDAHEQTARVHAEAARQHRRLAALFDGDDARNGARCGGALV